MERTNIKNRSKEKNKMDITVDMEEYKLNVIAAGIIAKNRS